MKSIPVPVAIGIMVLCILAGVTFGNRNALNRAKADSGASLAAVTEFTNARATHAGNLAKLADRISPDDPAIVALRSAMSALDAAQTPSAIAWADRELDDAVEAVRAMLASRAEGQDARLLTGVMDELASAEMMLARRITEYNGALAEVREVYDALPTRWLLGALPESFR